MTTLYPAVEERVNKKATSTEEIAYMSGMNLGATLQREHDLNEFERIIIEYFGKEDDGKTMLESLRGKI